MSADPATPALAVGVEDRPGTVSVVLMGVQHVLVSNVWLDPVFVAAVAGLPAALAANLVNAIFLAAGLVTLVQSTRLVRLPIVEGPSAAFDPLMITFAKAGRLAAATTGILLGALIVLALSLSGLLGRLRSLFTPAVAGSVLLLVGLALARFTLIEVLGGNPASPSFASPSTVLIAAVTMACVLALTLFARGPARRYAFLWALGWGTPWPWPSAVSIRDLPGEPRGSACPASSPMARWSFSGAPPWPSSWRSSWPWWRRWVSTTPPPRSWGRRSRPTG